MRFNTSAVKNKKDILWISAFVSCVLHMSLEYTVKEENEVVKSSSVGAKYEWMEISKFIVDIVHYTEEDTFLLVIDHTTVHRFVIRDVLREINKHLIYSTVVLWTNDSTTNLDDDPNQFIQENFRKQSRNGRLVVITLFLNDKNNIEFEKVMESSGVMTNNLVWILIGEISRYYLHHLRAYSASIMTISKRYFEKNNKKSSVPIRTPVISYELQKLGLWHKIRGLKMKTSIEYCCADLRGETLRVSILPHGALMILTPDNNTLIGGMCFDILNTMSETLNFSYTFKAPSFKIYGSNDTGKWSGMLGVLNKKEADIALGIFSWQTERMTVVDYLPVYLTGNLIIAYKAPERNFRWDGYLSTLHWHSWIVILVAMIVLCLALAVFTYVSMYKKTNDEDMMFLNASYYIVFLSSLFAQQGPERRPTSTSGSLLMLTSFMYGSFIFALFSTNLITKILQPEDPVDFRNLKELLLSKHFHPIMFLENYKFFKSDYDNIPPSAWDRFDEDKHVIYNIDTAIQRLYSERAAFFSEKYYLLPYVQNHSEIRIINDPIRHLYSFVMMKQHKYYHLLKRQILEMRETGVLKAITGRYKRKVDETASKMKDHNNILQDIKMSAVKLPFVTLFSSLCATFVILVLEHRIRIKSKNRGRDHASAHEN